MRRSLFLSVSIVVLAASSSYAENPRKLLARGNKLFASGNYAAAYDVFAEGNEKSPSPVFLRSMAFCKLKLFKHEEARKLFGQYLDNYPKTSDRDKITATVKELDVVVETRVRITSTPPGAEVFLDTETAGKLGVTPFEGTVEPGAHAVILKFAGYRTTVETFKIAAKNTLDLSVPLEVTLRVNSAPPGAAVHLKSPDTPAVGKTPYEGGVVPGRHKIWLKHEGFLTYAAEIDAQPGQESQPQPAVEAALKVGLRLASVPPGATVELDGKPVEGQTPIEVPAAPGQHQVTLTREGFKPYSATVTVGPGAASALEAQLQGGLLSMRTGPPGARVKVAGIDLGTTPLQQATVPIGEHQVIVTHPDRRRWQGALAFDDTQMVDARIKLGRPSWPMWTAVGLSAAGLVVGIVAGVAAKGKADDANNEDVLVRGTDITTKGMCTDGGDPRTDVTKLDETEISGSDCGYGIHHASTAGFIFGGVSAAFALTYYLLFVRPDEKIERLPRGTTAARR